MAHRNVFAEGEGRWKKGGGTNWLCVWIRHANIIRARIIIYAAKTNSCRSGGEMAEKLMTFAKQESKSSASSPAAGVAIRMSEHAWRCRRPCSAAVCKLALKWCLSGGHERPWAAILWISFQSFLLLLLLFTSVHRHDGTQSWGLRITTAFALTCFHFIWTKDHWGCSSLWCNPALRLKAQISILVWSCCCIQTLELPVASRALCMKAQRHASTTRGQRTSEFKEARTEALVNRQWSHKKNVLELAIGAQADVSISMHHAWGRGGAKSVHT